MTTPERTAAHIAAQRYLQAARDTDTAAMSQAEADLFSATGYWLQRRTWTVAEYRGESIPPKMIRMPHGRSIAWGRRAVAIAAWAAE